MSLNLLRTLLKDFFVYFIFLYFFCLFLLGLDKLGSNRRQIHAPNTRPSLSLAMALEQE